MHKTIGTLVALLTVHAIVPGGASAHQAPASQAVAAALTGVVRDASGQVVSGATILVRSSAGADLRTTTGPDGRFTIARASSGDAVLIVRAGGFAETRRTIHPSDSVTAIDVVLSPAGVAETVTVTATRGEQRTGDLPASVSVVSREAIRRSPAVVADDVLRQIPTFSLFRRTSSLSSHPTAQGVSLRGIGPSGVSRTLVLLDGVPFNDSFGGWVYWTRVPLESVERIEVVDNASSSLYGNYAMGGVINVVTAPASRRTFELRSQYGNRNSPKVDVSGSDVWGKVGLVVDGSGFRTDGFPIVAAAERGAVDNKASVDFSNVNVKLQYDPGSRVQATFRAGYFRESRDNGKASTIDGTEEGNDTSSKTLSGSARVRLPDASTLQVNVFGDSTDFSSNFLAVPAATPLRSIGRMTLNQRVPTDSVGALTQWSRGIGRSNFVTAGVDWRWVDGDSEEDGLDAQTGTTVTLRRVSGGTQRSAGLFVQDMLTPAPGLLVTLSARVDRWRNYSGHNLEASAPSGIPTANNNPSLPDRDDIVASPRIAARYHFSDRISVWGDLGTGFRAPTLNELYRQFRVGTVLTLANNQLGPERLRSGDIGVDVQPVRNLTWRATWFDNRIKDPVSNVTLTTAGTSVTQQRQNLGRTRVRGLQTDVEYRLGSAWRLSGGYLFNRAKVTEFVTNPTLVGKDLAQVPTHRGSFQIEYSNPRYLSAGFAVQSIGRQFDDDQNTPARVLPRFTLLSLTASRRLTRNVDVFAGVQNVTDRQYFVGTLPTTVGTPRMINGGVRIRFAPRSSTP